MILRLDSTQKIILWLTQGEIIFADISQVIQNIRGSMGNLIVINYLVEAYNYNEISWYFKQSKFIELVFW